MEETKPGTATSQTGQNGFGHPAEEPRLAEPPRRRGQGLPSRIGGRPGGHGLLPQLRDSTCTDCDKKLLNRPFGPLFHVYYMNVSYLIYTGHRLFLQCKNKLFMLLLGSSFHEEKEEHHVPAVAAHIQWGFVHGSKPWRSGGMGDHLHTPPTISPIARLIPKALGVQIPPCALK